MPHISQSKCLPFWVAIIHLFFSMNIKYNLWLDINILICLLFEKFSLLLSLLIGFDTSKIRTIHISLGFKI